MASIPTLIKQASGAAAATLDQVLGLDTDDAATVIQSIFRGERERKQLRKHPELQKRESEAPPPMPFARSTTAAVLREVRRQIDELSYRQIALLAAGCVAQSQTHRPPRQGGGMLRAAAHWS